MHSDGRHSWTREAEVTSADLKDLEGRPRMAISKRRSGVSRKNAGSSRKLALHKETIKDLTPAARGSAAKGAPIFVVRSRVSSLAGSSLVSVFRRKGPYLFKTNPP
jgi:hypothetical protein